MHIKGLPVVNSDRITYFAPPSAAIILRGAKDDPEKCTLARLFAQDPEVLQAVVGEDRVYVNYVDNPDVFERHPFPRNMKQVKELNDVNIRVRPLAQVLADSVADEVICLEPYVPPADPNKGKKHVLAGDPPKPKARRTSPTRRTRRLRGLV